MYYCSINSQSYYLSLLQQFFMMRQDFVESDSVVQFRKTFKGCNILYGRELNFNMLLWENHEDKIIEDFIVVL